MNRSLSSDARAGPLLSLARWWKEPLCRQSAGLMAASQVGNACNFLFQFLMMRRLPEAEYGALAAMLGLIFILGLPLESVRTAVAHGVAWGRSEGIGRPRISAWVRGWLRGAAGAGAGLIAGFFFFSGALASAFQLPAASAPVLVGVLLAGVMLLPVLIGALQGMEWFMRMALVSQLWAVLRLAVAAVLVAWIAPAAVVALFAHTAGLAVSIGVGTVLLARGLGRAGRVGGRFSNRALYVLFAFPALLGFAVLMNADVLWVQFRFAPDEAGLFARAVTLARAVAFLPMPVALVLFPKLVGAGKAPDSNRLVFRALALTLGVTVAGTVLGVLLAGPFWQLCTGVAPDPRALRLTRSLMLGLAPLGLVFTQLHVLLARRRFVAAAGLVLPAAIYAAALTVLARGIDDVPFLLAAAGTAGMLGVLPFCFSEVASRRRRKG